MKKPYPKNHLGDANMVSPGFLTLFRQDFSIFVPEPWGRFCIPLQNVKSIKALKMKLSGYIVR